MAGLISFAADHVQLTAQFEAFDNHLVKMVKKPEKSGFKLAVNKASAIL